SRPAVRSACATAPRTRCETGERSAGSRRFRRGRRPRTALAGCSGTSGGPRRQVELDAARGRHARAGWGELLELDRDRGVRVKLLDPGADRTRECLEQLVRRLRAERDDDLADLPIVDGV